MPEMPDDRYRALATYYGLYLRHCEGLASDEAAVKVAERYPLLRDRLRKLMNGKEPAAKAYPDEQ